MPTRRGWAAIAAGLGLWAGARFLGSDDLHMVAVGVLVLPFLATLFVQWNRIRLDIHRHLSNPRVHAGSRVVVSIELANQGSVTAPFLLLEDALPPALGRSARMVVAGAPPGSRQTLSYSVMARHRGRYRLGPLSITISDPFGLARVRIQAMGTHDLLVYPLVEELETWTGGLQGTGSGESATRYLYRSAAEFYTMREYVTGDDLRRIHWPSVARTGQLMIRQDEATRRSIATLFLDNRAGSLGTSGSPGFERGVSVAASIGRQLLRAGFALTFSALDRSSAPLSDTALLEILAGQGTVRTHGISEALTRVRSAARSDASLAYVSAPPPAAEVAALARIGSGFGRKLAVFVYPVDPATLSPEGRAEVENRASGARATLQHAGWDVFVLPPDGRLADVWRFDRSRRLRAAAPSS
jgi:uncharacterized protein (DUF58 family)